jgi:hypothetical protein
MRTTKSGVAVGFCVLLFKLLDRGSPMLAGLASVFALREDCSQSLHHGIRRVGGNTVAGILRGHLDSQSKIFWDWIFLWISSERLSLSSS